MKLAFDTAVIREGGTPETVSKLILGPSNLPGPFIKMRPIENAIVNGNRVMSFETISPARAVGNNSTQPRLFQIQFAFEFVQEFLAQEVLAVQRDEMLALGGERFAAETAAFD